MNPAEKPCPFCLETIKAGALRCKHCHADLTAVSAPPTSLPSPASMPLAALSGERISAPLASWQVLDLLSHLVDKNLVVYEEDEHGHGRYRLLETVRQYTRERLMENEQAHALLRPRHRDHFLSLAEEAKPKLSGPEQALWLDTLESEHDNLRAALEWCLDEEDEEEGAQAGLRLSGTLLPFWATRGHLSEGRQRCAAALARPGVVAAAQERTKARAEALRGAGYLAHLQGDHASAQALFEEALAIFRERGDKAGIANSLNNLGLVAIDQGDYSSARSLYEESLALQRKLGDKAGTAKLLNNLGTVPREQGDYSSARSLYEESLALQREIGNKGGIASSLFNLGTVAQEQGDYSSARSLYEESLALQREISNKVGIANSLNNLGLLACTEHDYAASRSCLAECLTLCLVLGEKRLTAYALEGCAALSQAQEQPERAARLYGASDGLRAAIGAPLPPNGRAEFEASLAALRTALGEEAFDSAWATGQAMTWEQAIEYALEDGSA